MVQPLPESGAAVRRGEEGRTDPLRDPVLDPVLDPETRELTLAELPRLFLGAFALLAMSVMRRSRLRTFAISLR